MPATTEKVIEWHSAAAAAEVGTGHWRETPSHWKTAAHTTAHTSASHPTHHHIHDLHHDLHHLHKLVRSAETGSPTEASVGSRIHSDVGVIAVYHLVCSLPVRYWCSSAFLGYKTRVKEMSKECQESIAP
jgi:hypothetical protein